MEQLFFFFLGVLLALTASFVFNKFRRKPFEVAASALLDKTERDIEARRCKLEEALRIEKQHFDLEREKQARELSREKESLARREQALEEQNLLLKTRSKTATSSQKELERIAGLSFDEAKSELLEKVRAAAEKETRSILTNARLMAQKSAEEEARNFILTAMCRMDRGDLLHTTTITVPLPNEALRSKIIGRDGRNIHTFEKCTGTSLIIEDTASEVTISCFDPMRRHIARTALEALFQETKIYPGRIEEIVTNAEQSVDRHMIEIGRAAALDCGISDFDPKILKVLGSLDFRSSFGQNVLAHSIEVANLSKMVARQLSFRESLACRIGLLHDIGKALPPKYGTSHALAGYNFALECKLERDLALGIGAHHGEMEGSEESQIVKITDALSAERPGCRENNEARHVGRLEELEALARAEVGVDAAYAMGSGKEVRVFVRPEEVDDAGAERLAETLADRIEASRKFPGKIQVTIIREKKVVTHA
jgi:ribonuclease Y